MDIDYKNLPLDTQYAIDLKEGYYLPFIIDRITTEITVQTFEDRDGFESLTLNEKLFSFSSTDYNYEVKGGHFFYAVIAVMFGIIFPLIGFDELLYFFILESIALFFAWIAYRNYKKWKNTKAVDQCILDRQLGEITLPTLKRKSYFKIKFNDLRAVKDRSIGTIYNAAAPYSILFILRGVTWRFVKSDQLDSTLFDANYYDAKESWSFYVWYMDKNRPLPPGSAFDPYRQQDFERRKAEGFPPPLYKSVMPTPEATPEQQLVREAFWKDEDHIADAKEAYYNSTSIKVAVEEYKKNKAQKRKEKEG